MKTTTVKLINRSQEKVRYPVVVLSKQEQTEYINEEIALSNIWRQFVTKVRSSEATRGGSN